MTDPIIEAAARALAISWFGSGIDEVAVTEVRPDAIAVITTIEPMIRAQVEREIVAYLGQLDAERRETNLLAWAARKIEAGEHRHHNPNCAVVRNGNLRAWCDCGEGDDA